MPMLQFYVQLVFIVFQKKTEFSCPHFPNVQGKPCRETLSYQDICQLIPLTDHQREFIEENLAALFARRLFDFKAVRYIIFSVCMHMASFTTSQVTFVYIALLTIQILSKQLYSIK